MKVAMAYSTKDRADLSVRSIEPLLQRNKFDLFIMDGSTTEEGQKFPAKVQLLAGENHNIYHHHGVRGGPDAAIVYALTTMLAGTDYDILGLCENDVLLDKDWFGPTVALFERGRVEGLEVGAVSTRCYQDRILIQRDGYAVCHNLGAGQILFTRKAARLVLDNFRTTHTLENRKLFAQLAGKDIGTYWAFGASEHWLCADWGFDKVLSAHGLASLALTPSPCEMLDQDPANVGLKIVDEPFELLRDDKAFALYAERTRLRREGSWMPNVGSLHHDGASSTIFPHQIPSIGGDYRGNWKLKWQQGFGPFAYRAGGLDEFPFYHTPPGETAAVVQNCNLTVPLLGPAQFMVGGGKLGGQVEVIDEATGYQIKPDLPPDNDGQNVLSIDVPAGCVYRDVKLTALSPGVVFYGLRVRDPQPSVPYHFDHEDLPGT